MKTNIKKKDGIPSPITKVAHGLYWSARVLVDLPASVQKREKLSKVALRYGFLNETIHTSGAAEFVFSSSVPGRARDALEEFCEQLAHDKVNILRYWYSDVINDSNTFDVLQVMKEDLYADH